VRARRAGDLRMRIQPVFLDRTAATNFYRLFLLFPRLYDHGRRDGARGLPALSPQVRVACNRVSRVLVNLCQDTFLFIYFPFVFPLLRDGKELASA